MGSYPDSGIPLFLTMTPVPTTGLTVLGLLRDRECGFDDYLKTDCPLAVVCKSRSQLVLGKSTVYSLFSTFIHSLFPLPFFESFVCLLARLTHSTKDTITIITFLTGLT